MQRITIRHRGTLVATATTNVLLLSCLLPLLVPFGLVRNIAAQAMCLSLAGIIAWTACAFTANDRLKLVRTAYLIIGLYCFVCAFSAVVHHTTANVFGNPLSRLGSVELIACAGIGLCLRSVAETRLFTWLYVSLTSLAAISLPYSLLRAHHLVRVGGLLHQPDFLALTTAVALLMGMAIWKNTTGSLRTVLIAAQLYLATVLFFTQTRAVIVLLFLVIVLWVILGKLSLTRKILLVLALLCLTSLGIIGMQNATDGRLTDTTFASQSSSYRVALQSYALRALPEKPLIGYGAGSLSRPLACSKLHNSALQYTCHHGYYFDSSHNIFIDRTLAFGWLGGLSFAAIVVLALWRGFTAQRRQVTPYIVLLIALYYCTNVTSLEIEMLLWIMLARCLPTSRALASP